MTEVPKLKFTEVADDLWSMPVQGGVIYRYGRSSSAHIAFAPLAQQQFGLGMQQHPQAYPYMGKLGQHPQAYPYMGKLGQLTYQQ